ncbi:MAG: hypothetical protein A2Z20_02940 [Bdellovibrionales bacterium RBG_16_40_8]|nr:MAG: hypothetical protein A2Z20_02940 [Bdellovibrionales bacterium RBG_16_40_8]
MDSSIDSFVDKKVMVLRETDEVIKAARAMGEGQVGCVVVADNEGHISGIVTDRDIACNLVSNEMDPHTKLSEIMETDVVSLSSESTLEQAIMLLKENGIRRLPIIEETKHKKQRCIGILTLDDLIAGQFLNINDLSEIIKTQIQRKKRLLGKSKNNENKLSNAYHKFISLTSIEIDLNEIETEEVVRFIVGSIVRRLHYTGGAHLIANLPKQFQEEMLDLPAGPDRNITSNSLIQGVALRTGKSLPESAEIIYKFWQIFRKLIGVGSADHILHQLPESMREGFEKLVNLNDEVNHESRRELSV